MPDTNYLYSKTEENIVSGTRNQRYFRTENSRRKEKESRQS